MDAPCPFDSTNLISDLEETKQNKPYHRVWLSTAAPSNNIMNNCKNSLLRVMAATIHASALPPDLKRSHSYMLRVTGSYRPDHDGVPAKKFPCQ
jgi:hypothetical protein